MDILYVDQWLIVINKPSGLLSIQDGYDRAIPHVRTIIEPEFGRCWIVHRLDKETTGVLILARNKEVHRSLCIQFESRTIKKEYRSIIWGIPSEKEFDITLPLRINADRYHRTRVDVAKGKFAQTNVAILRSYENRSLLSISPTTGYTHQIRAHLAYQNLPIIGDSLYWSISDIDKNNEFAKFPNLALHAFSINFEHPATNSPLHIQCNPPQFFSQLIK